MRGGKREGAGRPTGSTKPETVVFYRRVSLTEKQLLEVYLNKIREGASMCDKDNCEHLNELGRQAYLSEQRAVEMLNNKI